MNKFKSKLTNGADAIKEERASIMEQQTVLACDALINKLEQRRAGITSKIHKLTDIGPENTYSLRVGGPDFDAEKWVNDLHALNVSLALVDVDLDKAKEMKDEWFSVTEQNA